MVELYKKLANMASAYATLSREMEDMKKGWDTDKTEMAQRIGVLEREMEGLRVQCSVPDSVDIVPVSDANPLLYMSN